MCYSDLNKIHTSQNWCDESGEKTASVNGQVKYGKESTSLFFLK